MFSRKILNRIKNSLVWGFVLLGTSFAASSVLILFEGIENNNKDLDSLSDVAWWWIQTVTGLGSSVELISSEAKLIAVFIILAGFVLLGLFISDFSEIFRMVYARHAEGNITIKYKNHIVIFGYTSLTAGVIKLLRRNFGTSVKIVLISNDIETNPFPSQVDFLHDNPIDKSTLAEANIENATAAIILANDRFRDPDTYSLVIASGIENRNSKVTTIVELADNNIQIRKLFKRINIDAFINREQLLTDLLGDNPNPKLKRIIEKESYLDERLTEDFDQGLI